jgi:hypothetical protein
MSEPCDAVMAFYITSLASAVGPSYQAPSLVFLARRWFDSSSEFYYELLNKFLTFCLKMKCVTRPGICSILLSLVCLMMRATIWLKYGNIIVGDFANEPLLTIIPASTSAMLAAYRRARVLAFCIGIVHLRPRSYRKVLFIID